MKHNAGTWMWLAGSAAWMIYIALDAPWSSWYALYSVAIMLSVPAAGLLILFVVQWIGERRARARSRDPKA